MPQMAPINWLTLMIMFIITMIMFNIINYYAFNYQIKQKSSQMKKSHINWKW